MSETVFPWVSGAGGLDRIYDGIEGVLPGVQHSMVQLVLWDAIEEFCTRSTIWRVHVGWSMEAGVASVNLNPIDEVAAAVWVLSVHAPGGRFRLKPPAQLVDLGPTTMARSGTAKVVAKPRRLAEEVVPSFLVDDWSEALRDGALYRLYTQPFKPYTSPQLAVLHGKKWRYALTLAQVTAKRANDCPPYFPYFARGQQARGWPIGRPCDAGPLDADLGGGSTAPPVTVPPVSVGPGIITASPAMAPFLSIGPGIPSSDEPTVVTPAGPSLGFSLGSVVFPGTTVGDDADSTITLTNTGTQPLVISGVSASGDFAVTGLEAG